MSRSWKAFFVRLQCGQSSSEKMVMRPIIVFLVVVGGGGVGIVVVVRCYCWCQKNGFVGFMSVRRLD